MTDRTETAMTPNDVLDAAAYVILERGWTQGRYEDDDGAVCVRGALAVAVGRNPASTLQSEPAALRAYLALREATGGNLSVWNDAEAEVMEDVLRLLENTRVEDDDG